MSDTTPAAPATEAVTTDAEQIDAALAQAPQPEPEALDLDALLKSVDDDDDPAAPEAEAKPREPEPEPEPEPAADDDKYSRAFSKLSKREKELRARESELKDQVAVVQRMDEAFQLYHTDPVRYFKAQLEYIHGSPEAAQDAFAELYNQLTLDVLGVEAPSDLKEGAQYRKLQRELEQFKRQHEDEKRQSQLEAAQAQAQSTIARAKSNIQVELAGHAQEFPFLVGQQEYDPAELVYQIIYRDWEDQHAQGVESPVALDRFEAAARADAFFREQAERWSELAAKNGQAKVSPTPKPQSLPQATNRAPKAPSITNRVASQVPATKPPPDLNDEDAWADFAIQSVLGK